MHALIPIPVQYDFSAIHTYTQKTIIAKATGGDRHGDCQETCVWYLVRTSPIEIEIDANMALRADHMPNPFH